MWNPLCNLKKKHTIGGQLLCPCSLLVHRWHLHPIFHMHYMRSWAVCYWWIMNHGTCCMMFMPYRIWCSLLLKITNCSRSRMVHVWDHCGSHEWRSFSKRHLSGPDYITSVFHCTNYFYGVYWSACSAAFTMGFCVFRSKGAFWKILIITSTNSGIVEI